MKDPRTLVMATNNAHKLQEVRQILGDSLRVVSLADIGCHDDIPETGDTLEANAAIKARWVAERYGVDCFADDTGLEVRALGGAPGVRSARYAPGAGHDSAANTALLLKNLEGVQDRRARFRTAVCLILSDGREYAVEGAVEGVIAAAAAGGEGFGYDPVFVPDGAGGLTFAQMGPESKNALSHRGRAIRALRDLLGRLQG